MIIAVAAVAASAILATTAWLTWTSIRSDHIHAILAQAVLDVYGSHGDHELTINQWRALTRIPLARREAMIRAGISAHQAHALTHISNTDLAVMAALR